MAQQKVQSQVSAEFFTHVLLDMEIYPHLRSCESSTPAGGREGT